MKNWLIERSYAYPILDVRVSARKIKKYGVRVALLMEKLEEQKHEEWDYDMPYSGAYAQED